MGGETSFISRTEAHLPEANFLTGFKGWQGCPSGSMEGLLGQGSSGSFSGRMLMPMINLCQPQCASNRHQSSFAPIRVILADLFLSFAKLQPNQTLAHRKQALPREQWAPLNGPIFRFSARQVSLATFLTNMTATLIQFSAVHRRVRWREFLVSAHS